MPTTLSRQHYLDKNICPNCKGRPLKESYSQCEVCLEATNKWMRENRARKDAQNKARYEELRAQSRCVQCKRPTSGNVYCEECTTNRVRTRAYYRGLHSRNRWSKR